MRVKGAFPVRWAAQDGEKGEKGDNGADAYTAEFSPSTVSVSTDSGGLVDDYGEYVVQPTLYKGHTPVYAPTVTLGTLPSGVAARLVANSTTRTSDICIAVKFAAWKSGAGAVVYTAKQYPDVKAGDAVYNASLTQVGVVTSTGTVYVVVNGVTYSADSSSDKGTLAAAVDVPVTLKDTENNVSKTATIKVVPNKRGATGPEGLQGKFVRNRGQWAQAAFQTSTETIYNNDSVLDYITYLLPTASTISGTSYRKIKYRLADNIISYQLNGDGTATRTYTVNGETKTATAAVVLPSGTLASNTVWTAFNQLSDTAVSFLVADGIAADSAAIAEAFIGSGGRQNPDGTISVGNAVGWAINDGSIWHTQTKLALEKDGTLSDPDGLHLKVGGRTANSLMSGRNLLADPIFALDTVFTSLYTPSAMTAELSQEDTVESLASPWAEDGGRLLQIAIKANANSNEAYTYPNQRRAAVTLEANTQYTFSVWYRENVTKGTRLITNTVAQARLSASETGSGASYKAVPTTSVVEGPGGWKQAFLTFTTDDTRIKFTWIPYATIAGGSTGAVIYAGAKLELGATPTQMDYQMGDSLLRTGIDIKEGKMLVTSDQFAIQNNEGDRTFDVNEWGDVSVYGAVNAQVKRITQENYGRYLVELNDGSLALNLLHLGDVIELDGTLSDPGGVFENGASLAMPGGISGSFVYYKSDKDGFYPNASSVRQLLGRKVYIYNFMSRAVNINLYGLYYGDTNTDPHDGTLTLSEGCIAVFETKIVPYNWDKVGDECLYWYAYAGGAIRAFD